MNKLIPLLLILVFTDCKRTKNFKSGFEAHKYDQTVLKKLQQYDTLRQIILKNYDSFHLTNSKYDFTYIYNFDSATKISGQSNTNIPGIIYGKTTQLFEKIGRGNIFGFTIYKDSTLNILIRNTHLTKYFLDVRERLYWYPKPSKISKWNFPFKDTLLTDKWQYLIWYDKRQEF